jgi:hypothetical protein
LYDEQLDMFHDFLGQLFSAVDSDTISHSAVSFSELVSDGKHVEGTWSKASQTSPIELLDSTGAVIKLAPGNTWVELKPDDVTMIITP